jgi:GNAT superfamily N-acetyltransferase
LTVRIVPASPARLREVGGLRWDDATSAGADTGTTRDAFAEQFHDWAVAHSASHHGLVGVDVAEGTVLAFGFLAVTPRVPTAERHRRTYGDVQSVWVAPDRRGAGVGARLVTALLDLARELGVEHVTVHSSTRAVTLYERVGFVHDRELLYLEP